MKPTLDRIITEITEHFKNETKPIMIKNFEQCQFEESPIKEFYTMANKHLPPHSLNLQQYLLDYFDTKYHFIKILGDTVFGPDRNKHSFERELNNMLDITLYTIEKYYHQ